MESELAQRKTVMEPGPHGQTGQDSCLGSATSQLCGTGSDVSSVSLREDKAVSTSQGC